MNLLSWFGRRPVWVRIPIKILMVWVIGTIDHFTGNEVSFSIFYLIPIATTAWLDGKVFGGLMSVACGVVWLAADMTSGHEYTRSWIPFWNMSVRMGFFIIVAFAIARLRQVLVREEELSRVDHLTGLWNVRGFLEFMDREVQRCRRSGRPITIAYMDLDDFKQVNDTKGHAEGDALLHEVGEKIKQEVRGLDIPGRLGGDEFALLLPEAGFDQSSIVLLRLKESLGSMMQARNIPVTFSLGAVTFEATDSSTEAMIKMADDLMYRVKRDGKNAIRHELVRGENKGACP
ncbi:MAG: GGDEF domain-containing protein [Planctomycetes bacterium]|nr:GGDEF domain-containing protein [Planctomycetota bacterium]